METAQVAKDLIAITFTQRADDNSEWLTIECPNGWDDVKKLTKKVLMYKGNTFTFMSWNSDRNDCHFKRNNNVAKVI